MKWIGRAAAAVLALVVVVAAGGYLYLRASLPQTGGEIRLAGLSAPVTIVRDAYGIPHIQAGSAADAWFALGFVHAQDRLFQMEITRRVGQGRLSELVGSDGLRSDRFMRIIGVARGAEASLGALSSAARDQLDAYAAGVNAFLAGHPVLPPQLLLLRDTPEPWRPADTLIWARLMALQLSGNWREELERAELTKTVPPDLMVGLWPDRPADGATTLTHLSQAYEGFAFDRLAAALPPPLGPDLASNEWVVSGAHTASGKPLLANDPHLGLTAPGQWYLVRIDAPGLSVAGASAPGVPAVILGHNEKIAWGFTTTGADTFDLFLERTAPDDPTSYLTPEGPQRFNTHTETIKVRGAADERITVRATRHGPVISDAMPDAAPGEVLALASPAYFRPDTTAAAMFEVNRAQNWADFLAALSGWHAPIQNVVYADVDGHIGFITPGLIPHRKTGEGWLPQPGWTGEYDWDGFVPFAELPRSFDPPVGRIVNANNRVVSDDFPVFITREWAASFRARRINELLDATAHQDLYSSAAMQTDAVSIFAREVHDRLGLVKPKDDASGRALELLAAWDGSMRRDRPEPLIFNAWMRSLILALLHDGTKYDLRDYLTQRSWMVLAAFEGSSVFCKDRPGGCAAVISDALASALADLSQRVRGDFAFWRWDSLHDAPFLDVVFSRVPVLRDLIRFKVAADGDFYTINAGATSLRDPSNPFADIWGPGYRAIYDMSDLDASRFIVAPGQSANPLSRHWGDLAALWAGGRNLAIPADTARLGPDSQSLTLTPR
ncbi:MAG: penicillin acylase family protein [Alphaproteobacteria bacterium]|nr:penicillin acylase family protein [Alphaproteobacteria bacterium]